MRYWMMQLTMLTFISAYCQKNESVLSQNENHILGKVWEITPDQDIRKFLPRLAPGDQLVLHQGVYNGSLLVDVSGIKDFPITIRGYGVGEDRPVLLYEGTTAEGVKITGNNLILDYIEFKSLDTYCVRIGKKGKGAENITIKNSLFYECGGGDISANYYDVAYDNIHILNNYFIGSKRTPVYIGNHRGTTSVTHFTFKGNVIDGSQNDGPETTVGYGIELKLNVTKSVVANNFVTGTKGPGIMVYGAESQNLYDSNIVRNNIIINSRKEAGIVVGGGPSVVEDNIVMNSKWGIYVQNYGNRNLLKHIVINRNTLVNNFAYGLSFQNNKNIYTAGNIVYTDTIAPGYKETPGLNDSNRSVLMSQRIVKIAQNLMNIIPGNSNLSNIWRYSMTGPLSEQQLIWVSKSVLEHPVATKKKH